jgi:hypothetical protein
MPGTLYDWTSSIVSEQFLKNLPIDCQRSGV